MSSQLTSLVPIFDGTNYQQWVSAMQSFLMSQGQWKCIKPGATVPKVSTREVPITSPKGKEAETEVETETITDVSQSDVDNWLEDAEKALGNIRLRLHHTIGYQFNDVENPAFLWKELKEKYGDPGVAHEDSASIIIGRNTPLIFTSSQQEREEGKGKETFPRSFQIR